MKRGRVIFWSVAGPIIAGGAGYIIWLQYTSQQIDKVPAGIDFAKMLEANRLKADQAPEPWTPPHPWWKRVTIDAYDRMNAGNPWPCGRRAVVGFGASLARGPLSTDDEKNDAKVAATAAMDFNCTDPLVAYIAARSNLNSRGTDSVNAITTIIRAAGELRDGRQYPPFLRCLALYEAAPRAALRSPQNAQAAANQMLDAAESLWPELAADRDMPLAALAVLVAEINTTCDATKQDQRKRVEPLLAALEKAGHSKSFVQTVRGIFLVNYAWDARGVGYANTVTEAGFRGFAQRLGDARAALTEAWEADNNNSTAAEVMITVCMGDGSDRPEMEQWFKRAMAANPANESACSRKMLYLEPKWGGSVPSMILFGRELTRSAAVSGAGRVPLILATTHWTLSKSVGAGNPSPEYFTDNPEAWDDISRVYELYLKQVPNSRYHRTRYAVLAGWSGKWDVCAKQFDLLGDRYQPNVVAEPVLKALRDRARREAGGGAKG